MPPTTSMMSTIAICKRSERPTVSDQSHNVECERPKKKQEIDWEWVREKERRREIIGPYKPGTIARFKEEKPPLQPYKRAGQKCVIVDTFFDEERGNKLYCLVTGIDDQETQDEDWPLVKCYIKLVESATLERPSLGDKFAVDFRDIVTFEALKCREKKKAAAKEAKRRFKQRYETGKDSKMFRHVRCLRTLKDASAF